jgi:5-methylcytosine-specific restriction endonuclease McrA
MTAQPIPLRVRRIVWARSGYNCEACGLPGADHIHHRKLRSQGGRHDPVNLLHVHHACHEQIHAHPERAYALGLLVRGWADPEAVPVRQWTGVSA